MTSTFARTFGQAVAMVAGVFLAIPSAGLPCLAADRLLPCAVAADTAVWACSAACEREPQSCEGKLEPCECEPGSAAQPDRSSTGEEPAAPCECPPGCPAPCGAGKLPCPQPDNTGFAATPGLVQHFADPSADEPHSVSSAGVFHPPRV